MRRTAIISGLVLSGFAFQAAAMMPSATAQPERQPQVITGVVTMVVRETQTDRRPGVEDTDLVISTKDGMVRLTDDSRVTPGQRVTVEVADAENGAMRVTDVLAASTRQAPAASAAAADVDRQVFVAIVAPQGWPLASNTNTAQGVADQVARASEYWSSQTNGTVHFSVASTLAPYQSGFACHDTYGMWNEALDKFRAQGITAIGAGKYLMVVAPDGASETDSCGYGYGTLGSLDHEANAVFVSAYNQSLYAHELGHNLGLDHSNSLRCAGAQDGLATAGEFPTTCLASTYDDLMDVMGYSGETYGEGNLGIAHVDDLGVQPDAITSVSGATTRTITIAPLSASSAVPRGIKVTDALGVNYFVEYRTDSGRDHVAHVNPWRPELGVQITRENPQAYQNHGSFQLDATPTDMNRYEYNRALKPGSALRTASGLTSFQVVSQDATGATIKVVNSATQLSPTTLTITAPGKKLRKGTVARFATTVTDQGGTRSPYSEVYLQTKRTNGLYATIASETTTASGRASASYPVTRSGYYRWVTADGTRTSAAKLVRVR